MSDFRKGPRLLAIGAAVGALALALPAAAQFGGPPPAPNTGVPIHARLVGGNASGNITVVVDPPKGQACYLMNVAGVENVTRARILAGENGNAVLNLDTPRDGSSGGCVQVTAQVAEALLANPGNHYVTLETGNPAAALRGQLQNGLEAIAS